MPWKVLGSMYLLHVVGPLLSLKKMEGNAKIIKFIARDENVHLASTTTMLKLLKKEDKDFEKIAKEMEPAVNCII